MNIYFVTPEVCIGIVFIDQGKPSLAMEKLERAIAICEKQDCNPEALKSGYFGLARALLASGGDRARAIRLSQKARDLYSQTPNVSNQELEEVTAWLAKHSREKGLSLAKQPR